METAITQILDIMKNEIGISTNTRDSYFTTIIESIIKELEGEKGIVLEPDNINHLMFIANYSTWRYGNRDSTGSMPRHLQWRLHNLFINSGGKKNV